MCPSFERVERIVQKAVDGCEKVVGVDGQEAVRQELMVKRFRRSAAGDDAQLPSDVRPPMILKVSHAARNARISLSLRSHQVTQLLGNSRLSHKRRCWWPETAGENARLSVGSHTQHSK